MAGLASRVAAQNAILGWIEKKICAEVPEMVSRTVKRILGEMGVVVVVRVLPCARCEI